MFRRQAEQSIATAKAETALREDGIRRSLARRNDSINDVTSVVLRESDDEPKH
jgi:hypothetical protein